jgi:hypothetical protein
VCWVVSRCGAHWRPAAGVASLLGRDMGRRPARGSELRQDVGGDPSERAGAGVALLSETGARRAVTRGARRPAAGCVLAGGVGGCVAAVSGRCKQGGERG